LSLQYSAGGISIHLDKGVMLDWRLLLSGTRQDMRSLGDDWEQLSIPRSQVEPGSITEWEIQMLESADYELDPTGNFLDPPSRGENR
jgi:hypothetical protein